MAREPLAPLDHKINHVRKRLLLRIFLSRLTWCLTGALAVAAVCMLLQAWLLPKLLGEAPLWPRLGLAAALAVVGVLLAGVLALFDAPSKLTAALMLDEKFGLRERVTTSLSLTPEQRSMPIGQALLEDADQRVAGLDVRSRIGIPFGWAMSLVPLCLVLAIVTAVFCPVKANPNNGELNGNKLAVAEPADLKDKKDELRKAAKEEKDKFKRQPNQERNKDVEDIVDDLDSVISAPADTEEKRREQLAEVTDLVDRLEKKEKELAAKQQAQQEQLDRLTKKPKEGPAKDLQDALTKGDLNKARQEAERLSKELEEGSLSKEDQKALKEQVEQLEKELERLSRLEDEKEELKDLEEKGEIDEETLDREMEQLQKMEKDLKDLQDLADELKECQSGLDNGDGEKSAQAMKRVAAKIKKMNDAKQAQDSLSKLSRQAKQTKASMARGMGGGQPGGRRPEAKEGDTTAKDTNVTTATDPKGKKIVTGHGPLGGKSFKPKSSDEMSKEIKQAAQDAPEAIARQRIPKAASDIAKGYYETLGGQKDGELPKKK